MDQHGHLPVVDMRQRTGVICPDGSPDPVFLPSTVHPFVHPFRSVRRNSGTVAGSRAPRSLASTRQIRTFGYLGEPQSPELISPWSQVRIPPPPLFPRQDAES